MRDNRFAKKEIKRERERWKKSPQDTVVPYCMRSMELGGEKSKQRNIDDEDDEDEGDSKRILI